MLLRHLPVLNVQFSMDMLLAEKCLLISRMHMWQSKAMWFTS